MTRLARPARLLGHLGGQRTVIAEPHYLSPSILGTPLARPGQRLAAILLDLLVIGLLSALGLWALGVALLWIGLNLRRSGSPLAAAALPAMAGRWRWWVIGTIVCAALAQVGWTVWHASTPSADGGHPAPTAQRGKPEDDVANPAMTPQEQIDLLREQLQEARAPRSVELRATLLHWADDLGMGLGWALVYFTLVPVWMAGQTVGKKLMGIRVVTLTGKPLSILQCFSRYGGYAAGMATGFFGFAQLLWDANRQAIQDKIANTVVVTETLPDRLAAP